MNEKINVLVIGGTGMLGSMVTDVLRRNKNLSVISTARDLEIVKPIAEKVPEVEWMELDVNDVAKCGDFESVCSDQKFIINCVGMTKPYTHDGDMLELVRAVRVNVLFPQFLNILADDSDIRILQIATDCVYSGVNSTVYTEKSPHDGYDVYGKTKSLGEVNSVNFTNIRNSIIGPEFHKDDYLLHWFLNQPQGATVNGYTNHLWNGVTTYHFAKICEGIIFGDLHIPNIQHIVPGNVVSKAGMLNMFAESYNRTDIKINNVEAPVSINRVLDTINPVMNETLWSLAGYKTPPTVEQMIEECSKFDYAFK